ncbi:kinase [Thraustotheca clavata]|uniref:Kinase n=1 Tax=Thraustotheca clavata TaxID=74557 RepID=A0A1W0A2X1_9STRA|nr:kinase [Thraustotheca clavata]
MLNNYFVEGVIARALYGQVLLCRNDKGTKSAVKRVDVCSQTRSSMDSSDDFQLIRDEIEAEKNVNLVLKRYRHRNVVAMEDHFEIDGYQHFVFEYCSNGELFEVLRQSKTSQFCEVRALHYFRQIVAGVHHMHRHGYAHRDLSLENILLDKDNICKICDFGLAVRIPGVAQDHVGKLNYMAPEVHAGGVYDPAKIDVWSLGMMLFIMISGVPLVDVPSAVDRRFSILKKYGVEAIINMWEMDNLFSTQVIDLLQSMLTVNPIKRVSISQVRSYLDSMDTPPPPPPPSKVKKPKKTKKEHGKWRTLFKKWF